MLASEYPIWFIRGLAFAFGAVFGSFANVVIYRWPRELSVVRPGSHCTTCNAPVRAIDNVPILAWFWLRGRCRQCHAKFSFRYPLVELIFAVTSVAVAERLFHAPAGSAASQLSAVAALALYVVRFSAVFGLLVASFIDLDEMVVPWFVKLFAIVPLAAPWFLPVIPPAPGRMAALLGGLGGYIGLRAFLIEGWRLLTGRRGMGLGDAEILLVIGALVGPAGVLFALGAGAVQGVIAVGIAWLVGARIGPPDADEIDDEIDDGDDEGDDDEESTKAAVPPAEGVAPAASQPELSRPKMKAPFVPFLVLGGLEYLLGADQLVDAYIRWLMGG